MISDAWFVNELSDRKKQKLIELEAKVYAEFEAESDTDD